jgi:phosphatidylserine decarboxylase
MNLQYIDRKSGKICTEKVYGDKVLTFLYANDGVFLILSKIILNSVAKISFISCLYGLLQKSPLSRKKIPSFIKNYNIDSSEFQKESFSSFNDFFTRKLKKKTRPIDSNPSTIVAPADGRYLVYPKIADFSVKGKSFDLFTFLQDSDLAKKYSDGSMVIVRLCPVDYHRFHFPVSGFGSNPKLINGPLYSVNPVALKNNIKILSENKRVITSISSNFGSIQYVEIGATFVGSIRQTHMFDQPFSKGDEKGYFEFGGSCIVLLFEKDQIILDQDLIENTSKGYETYIKMGQSIAQGK